MKKGLLRTFIGALVVTALAGMYVVLFGQGWDIEIKILLTTVAVSGFSMTGLACAVAEEKQSAPLISLGGLAASAVGFLMMLGLIWGFYDAEMLIKSAIIVTVFAGSLAQASLLSLAKLPKENTPDWLYTWVRGGGAAIYHITVGVILLLAVLVSVMILGEIEDEWSFRIVGVIGIADGCLSLIVPVFYKLHMRDLNVICPECGHIFVPKK